MVHVDASPAHQALVVAITELRILAGLRRKLVEADTAAARHEKIAAVQKTRARVVSALTTAATGAAELGLDVALLERIGELVGAGVEGPEDDAFFELQLADALPMGDDERTLLAELVAHPRLRALATETLARALNRQRRFRTLTMPETIVAIRAAAEKARPDATTGELVHMLGQFVRSQRRAPDATTEATTDEGSTG